MRLEDGSWQMETGKSKILFIWLNLSKRSQFIAS